MELQMSVATGAIREKGVEMAVRLHHGYQPFQGNCGLEKQARTLEVFQKFVVWTRRYLIALTFDRTFAVEQDK